MNGAQKRDKIKYLKLLIYDDLFFYVSSHAVFHCSENQEAREEEEGEK